MTKTFTLWDRYYHNGVLMLIDPEKVAEMVYTSGMVLVEDVNEVELENGLSITEIKERFGGDSIRWADDFTSPDEEVWLYQPEDGKWCKPNQLERFKIYEWWDGSNYQREVLEPYEVETVVTITEQSVCLDEWDGSNWRTGEIGHHEYVHLVLDLDGKPQKDLFLLVHQSQWQDEHTTAELMDFEELRNHLMELGRDEAKYLYEIGKLVAPEKEKAKGKEN